jgi:hypothetical protein
MDGSLLIVIVPPGLLFRTHPVASALVPDVTDAHAIDAAAVIDDGEGAMSGLHTYNQRRTISLQLHLSWRPEGRWRYPVRAA